MTTSAARFIADRLGKGSKLIRGGNEGGPTPNDGVIDVAGAEMVMVLPGVSGAHAITTVGTVPQGATSRAIGFVDPTDPNDTTTRYLWVYPSHRYRLRIGGTFGLTCTKDSDGSAKGFDAPKPDGAFWYRTDITWATGAVRIRTSDQPFSVGEANVVWASDTTLGGDALTAPASAGGTLRVGDVNAGTANSFEGSTFFHRWETDGQADHEFDPADLGNWTILNPDGPGFKARLVEDRNVANLDGTDDIWDCDLDAPADDEMAGLLAIERLNLSTALGTLISSGSASTDGFRIYAYQSTSGSAGKFVAVYRSPTDNNVVVSALDTYDDGEPFGIAWRVGDYDGVRTFSVRTDREGWKRTSLTTAVGDVTHGQWRIGTRAYAVSASHPMGFTEFVPFEFAPSEDNLDVALTALLEGAGKPV